MELSRHGTGTYTMTDFMLTYSRLTAIRCGGIGDGTGALPDQDSALAGDGLLHGITVAGTLHIGMVVTGVAIGDGTRGTVPISITITTIRPTTTIVPTRVECSGTSAIYSQRASAQSLWR